MSQERTGGIIIPYFCYSVTMRTIQLRNKIIINYSIMYNSIRFALSLTRFFLFLLQKYEKERRKERDSSRD